MSNTTTATRESEGVDSLLSASSVRKLLDCSDRTLRRWIAAGRFPAPDMRIGRSLRWKASTIRAFTEGEWTGCIQKNGRNGSPPPTR